MAKMASIHQTTSDISVIICTYTLERWDDLLASLNSVYQQTIPILELIIVIDYNQELFEKIAISIENAIVIQNSNTKGLSGARNCGLSAARGRFIAFLDDDAMADKDWLLRLSNWFEQPNVLGVGGKVFPLWTTPKPKWFPDEFYWVVGCSYTGLPTTKSSIRNLMGGSMCLRREIFDTLGGFRSELGRLDQTPLGCEETELCIRALQHWPECRFIYEPEAIVYHSIPNKRGKWSYFLSRCYSEGKSKARIARFIGASDGLSTERSYALRTLPAGFVRNITDSVVRGNFYGLLRAWSIIIGLFCTTFGFLYGSLIKCIERKKIS